MKSYKKPYLFVAIVAIVSINGCNPTTAPFKGKYEVNPVEIISTKTIDSAWLMIAELFDQKGLKIKTSDRKKGLIVTEKSSFATAYTFEDSNGRLVDPQAWVVLRRDSVNKKEWLPKQIYGRWNIQITGAGKGLSAIKMDPVIICTYYPNSLTSVDTHGQSTGILEELIKKSLTSNSN